MYQYRSIYHLAKRFFPHVLWLGIVPAVLLSSCTTDNTDMTPPIIGVSSETQYGNEITPEQKAELAKNRRKEIRLIRKGDYYMVKNNPEEALTSYLEVLEKLP